MIFSFFEVAAITGGTGGSGPSRMSESTSLASVPSIWSSSSKIPAPPDSRGALTSDAYPPSLSMEMLLNSPTPFLPAVLRKAYYKASQPKISSKCNPSRPSSHRRWTVPAAQQQPVLRLKPLLALNLTGRDAGLYNDTLQRKRKMTKLG